MRKDEHKTCGPKWKYRVRNWTQYDAGLIARGDVRMWIDRDVLKTTEVGLPKRGRPYAYPDAVIQMLPGLKEVYRSPLRALQGFAHSLRELAFADLPVSPFGSQLLTSSPSARPPEDDVCVADHRFALRGRSGWPRTGTHTSSSFTPLGN